jgi:hypothetical protein
VFVWTTSLDAMLCLCGPTTRRARREAAGTKPRRERRRGGGKRNAAHPAAAEQHASPQVLLPALLSFSLRAINCLLMMYQHSFFFLARRPHSPAGSGRSAGLPALLLPACTQLPPAALHDAPAVPWYPPPPAILHVQGLKRISDTHPAGF